MIYIFTYRTNEMEFETTANSEKEAWAELEKARNADVERWLEFGCLYVYLGNTHLEFWELVDTVSEED